MIQFRGSFAIRCTYRVVYFGATYTTIGSSIRIDYRRRPKNFLSISAPPTRQGLCPPKAYLLQEAASVYVEETILDAENLLASGSHLQTQQEGKRNQSMKIPLQSLSVSYESNRCHLYFCSQPQPVVQRFVCVFLKQKRLSRWYPVSSNDYPGYKRIDHPRCWSRSRFIFTSETGSSYIFPREIRIVLFVGVFLCRYWN